MHWQYIALIILKNLQVLHCGSCEDIRKRRTILLLVNILLKLSRNQFAHKSFVVLFVLSKYSNL